MRIKVLLISIIISCAITGCKNSSQKQQSEMTVQPINSLENVFKEAYANKETLYSLIRKDIIKERIIREYSSNFYEKAFNYSVFCYEIVYKDKKYIANGTLTRIGDENVELIYDPTSDLLTVQIVEQDRMVQSDGEIHYNTEGWVIDTHDVKNEFGEVVETECVALYKIDGIEYSYSKHKFVLVLRWNYLTLWTNEFGSLSDVESIQIKDHDSGEVYNIVYDERHHHQNGGAMNDDIGVFIARENMGNFIRLVSKLTNFSILIKSNYDDSVLISRPQNFNNIADVYQQIIANTEKMRNNENK